MRPASLCFTLLAAGCVQSSGGTSDNESSEEAEASGSDTNGADETATASSPSSDGAHEAGVSTSDGATGDDTTTGSSGPSEGSGSSTTGSGAEDPFTLCATALSEAECDAVSIEPSEEFGQSTCQWVDVYSVELTRESGCALGRVAPRCVFFGGFATGCGGSGPVCPSPNDGQPILRELEERIELLFYPYEEVCGPIPMAPPEEAQWMGCGFPPHEVCDCICELL